MRPIPVVIDTDPGIDDAMALRMAAASDALEILALTTVFGNADIELTTANALALCDRFGIDAPVHRGAGQPLQTARHPSPTHVHGLDGLGDAHAASATQRRTHAMPAAQAIVEQVRRAPHAVTLIALGPLTNLALALQLDPGIESRVGQVIVMGGAYGTGIRHGNVTPVAEANIWNDPHAAQQVFGAAWPLVAVGLDVTLNCVLDTRTARHLAEQSDDARYLWEISRRYDALYREHDGLDGSCLHDVAAIAYAIDPSLFDTRRGRICVALDGVAAGQTVWAGEDRRYAPGPWDQAPVQRVCTRVNAAGVLALYRDCVLRPVARGANPR